MNRIVILFNLLLLCSLARAQSPTDAVLWKVEKKGMATSYLFMTTKVQNSATLSFDPKVYSFLDKCDALCVDIDMSEEDKTTMKKSLYMESGDASTFFNEKDLSSYQEAVDSFMDIKYQYLKTVKPAIVALNIYGTRIEKDASQSIQDLLTAKNLQKNKSIYSLETIGERLGVLEEMDEEVLSRFFNQLSMVDAFVDNETFFYQNGNLNGLEDLYFRSDTMALAFKLVKLKERNLAFFTKLQKLFKTGESIFAALDIVHVLGENGLLQLLKNKGYELSPIALKKSKNSLSFDDVEWYTHRPEGEPFEVSFPSEPTFSFNNVETDIGDVGTFSWEYAPSSFAHGVYHYKMSFIDYPELIIHESDKEEKVKTFFEAEQNALENSLDGIVTVSKAFIDKKSKRLHCQIRSKENNLITHFTIFLVGSRVYTLELLATSHTTPVVERQVSRFINSFKLDQ